MSRTKLILSVDQGTTNTKALLIDHAGAVRARASRPLTISFPQPGWVEQDAHGLLGSVLAAAADCFAQVEDAEIVAMGISNQRESVVVWDRQTGEPAGPCVIWQCRRTSPFCDELRRGGLGPDIQQRSGLPVDPLFPVRRSAGSSITLPTGRCEPRPGTSGPARWTVGCCGT